jgi:hypothetical protein
MSAFGDKADIGQRTLERVGSQYHFLRQPILSWSCQHPHWLCASSFAPQRASSPRGTIAPAFRYCDRLERGEAEDVVGRGLLLWFLGIPIPVIILIWVLGGLHG